VRNATAKSSVGLCPAGIPRLVRFRLPRIHHLCLIITLLMCKLGGTLVGIVVYLGDACAGIILSLGDACIGIIVNLGGACVGIVKFGDAFIAEIV